MSQKKACSVLLKVPLPTPAHLHRSAASTLPKQWENSHRKLFRFSLEKSLSQRGPWLLRFPWLKGSQENLSRCLDDARQSRGRCLCCFSRILQVPLLPQGDGFEHYRTAGWRIGTLAPPGDWKVLPVQMLNLSSLTVWFKFVFLLSYFFFLWTRYRWSALSLKNPTKTKYPPQNLKRVIIDLNVQFCLTASCQNLSITPAVLGTILT